LLQFWYGIKDLLLQWCYYTHWFYGLLCCCYMLVFNAGKHLCKQVILFLSLSFYLWRQIGENGVVLCVVMLLLHSGVIWFYHGLNSIATMLLFTIVLLHTSLILALVFMAIWLVFLLKGLCRKLVLCALVSCWYTCFVYAQILFCRTFQV